MESVANIVGSYINDLTALRSMIEPVMIITQELGKMADAEHLKALEQYGTEIEGGEGKTRRFHVPPEHSHKIKRLATGDTQYRTAKRLLPRNFLVSFVSVHDAFLGDLVRALFALKPEILNSSSRQLTYKDLVSFENIHSARSFVVESEVEALLRKSHSDQFDWLEKTFDIRLRQGLEVWPAFIELTERRNLFVHNHGKVSSQYLKVCSANEVDVKDSKIGDTLEAKRQYLVDAYKCLYEIGVKLSQVMWRKLQPSELEKADTAIINITFDLLSWEKYDLATRLLEFAIRLPRHGNDVNKRVCTVNLAQAYKHTGNSKKCLETLDAQDWSACADNFRLCVAVLRDEYDDAKGIMQQLGRDGAIKQHEYISWPVFKEFRATEQFKSGYLSVFGTEPADIQEHRSEPAPTESAQSEGARE